MMHSYWVLIYLKFNVSTCLNPCCNGWCTRTEVNVLDENVNIVLILVVMDDALARSAQDSISVCNFRSLNPCCNGWCTRTYCVYDSYGNFMRVLILVVMDDALAHFINKTYKNGKKCLNPCCNGWCTRTQKLRKTKIRKDGSLNPCCNGWCTRTNVRRHYAPGIILS